MSGATGTLGARMLIRRDTAANWSSVNPVLASGEIGFATDTGVLKIGDGVTAWNSLDTLLAVWPGRTITFRLDGQGQIIDPDNEVIILVPGNATITGWQLATDVSATVTLDLQYCSYADYDTFAAIDGAHPMAISAAQKAQDADISDWTTSLAAGGFIKIVVSANDAATLILGHIDVEWV